MTASLSSIRVAFGAHEIELRSNRRDVLQSLGESFKHMKGSASTAAFAVAEVIETNGRFRVRPVAGAPDERATARDAVRWARQQVIEGMMRARPDLLWMHGAAVASAGRALLLPGARGRGKSTLATALCARGWRFLSDDVIALDPPTLHVHPFPRVPELREDPGEAMDDEWIREAPKAAFDVAHCLADGPHAVAAIVFPCASRTGAPESLERRTPSEAVRAIAEGCWNFAELGLLAPATLSRLVSGVPAMTLEFSDTAAAAERLAAWFAEGARAAS